MAKNLATNKVGLLFWEQPIQIRQVLKLSREICIIFSICSFSAARSKRDPRWILAYTYIPFLYALSISNLHNLFFRFTANPGTEPKFAPHPIQKDFQCPVSFYLTLGPSESSSAVIPPSIITMLISNTLNTLSCCRHPLYSGSQKVIPFLLNLSPMMTIPFSYPV